MKWTTKRGSAIERIVRRPSAAYLVRAGDLTILVDTGNSQSRKGLLKGLDRVEGLDHLVLTHAHYDHVANVGAVVGKFHPTVLSHRSNESLLREGENSPVKGTNAFVRAMLAVFGRPFQAFMRFDPVEVDRMVDDEEALNDHVWIVHTPGHTEGSISVIVDDEIALVGDLMFGIFPWSAMPPFGEDKDLIRDNWRKLLDTGCSLMLPAHGGPITAERLQRYFEKEAHGQMFRVHNRG
jgi:glyoxylase-like metal-dependent hydrolase (beta-lactamase superfamily II)